MTRKIIVYVEGPSDKLAMEKLLASLIQRLNEKGISLCFISLEGKKNLINKTPAKALNIIRNDPYAIVIAYPDLYPTNLGFPHITYDDLKTGLQNKFVAIMNEKNIKDDRLLKRFKINCFKYDLEVLLLASKKELETRLGVNKIKTIWNIPEEDQNHKIPPKRIIEKLFNDYGKKYKDTIDAPQILQNANYKQLASQCNQRFGKFIDFLESYLKPKNSA